MSEEKKARTARKSALTRSINDLLQCVAEEDRDSVVNQLTTVKEKFNNFQTAHDTYHSTLNIDDEIETSDEYFAEMQVKYTKAVKEARQWLNSLEDVKPSAAKVETASTSKEEISLLSADFVKYINLPNAALEEYDGDPLQYHNFFSLFDENVGSLDIDDHVKLNRLIYYTRDKARRAIKSCGGIGGTAGYKKARAILQERFGNEFLISEEVIKSLKTGKLIKSSEDLLLFADELRDSFTTLTSMNRLTEVDSQSCIADIASRLQQYIRNRWKRHAMEMKDKQKRYPTFEEFVSFVIKEASEANDPVYGQWGSKPKSTVEHKSASSKSSSYSNMASTSEARSSEARSSESRPAYKKKCLLCNREHRLFYCDVFKGMKPTERRKFVMDRKLCENCLLDNHMVTDCRKNTYCSVPGCGQKHTKFIHVVESNDRSQVSPDTSRVTNASVNADVNILVPVVPVLVGDKHQTHALLDTGSTNSFCTQSLIDDLKIEGRDVNFTLSTINASERPVCSKVVDLKVASTNGRDVLRLSNVFVVPEIPVNLPNVDLKGYPHIRDLPISQNVDHVNLLIGQDHCEALIPLQIKRGAKGEPFAVQTLFGWSINGPAATFQAVSRKVVSHFITGTIEEKINELWKIENDYCVGDDEAWSETDKSVIQLWDENVRLVDGHYTLPVPWKPDAHFPDNMSLALSRLKSLRSSLEKRKLFEKYDAEIAKLITNGYAEKADLALPKSDKIWYLPHQAVVSSKKPGKVRVVFDCAAKFQNECLNDKSYRGPNLNNNLLAVLLRFRQHEFAFTGDIEAMYYQARVPPNDRDALRFLWFGTDGQIVHYRMTCHVFGGVWCSSAATYALRQCLKDNPTVDDAISNVLLNDFYVDDCLVSIENAEEVLPLLNGVKDLVAHGGFRLTKFVVNQEDILQDIPAEERAVEVKTLVPESDSKALGILWDVNSDQFYFDVNMKVPDVVTKRGILSTVASTFDPLGLMSPMLIVGKVIFQDVTRLKLSWDEEVPPDIQSKWRLWLASLNDLLEIKVPRCVKPMSFNDAYLELHHFGDASLRAFGCCSYLRCVNKSGEISVSLLVSKSKVAPLKVISIPRLELQAAVLCAQIDVKLREELHGLDIAASYFWSDSQIVLHYIKNETRRFKVFVANRVGIIRSLTDCTKWNHVPGNDNPADMITRGQTPKQLDKRKWFHGPNFLHEYKSEWKDSVVDLEVSEDDPELVAEMLPNVVHAHVINVDDHPLERLFQHYSDFHRLKKGLAWLIRCREMLRKKYVPASSYLSVGELQNAELVLVKHVQNLRYQCEIDQLSQNKSIQNSSSLKDLCPILDGNGMLCVGGRIKNAVDGVQRHPYIVPRDHSLAKLIVRGMHESGHLGVEWTLGRLRSKFWIVRVRPLIKDVIRQCVFCKRHFGSTCIQKMADLPSERLEPNRPPFTFVGLDCFGPFLVKYRRAEVKRYGCIYTCFATRAVHIEKLEGLDTDSFLNGFRRFVARRGSPSKVWSDRGTNMVGANAELRKCLNELNEDEIQSYGTKRDVEWVFNPPCSSHMGGVWERLIRTVRKVMTGILSNSKLTDDSLSTLFCEVETIVNSRPITKVSDDVNDMSALTPNHLLLLRQGPVPPPGIFDPYDSDTCRKRWKHVQFLANQFWQKWVKSYLPELQKRHKWLDQQRNVVVGDIVLIVGENTPRVLWPLGLVIEAEPSQDGLVRNVKIRTKATVLTRPIHKLVLLEGCN